MPCPQCHSTCPPISCQKTATASEEKHDARPQKASLASGTDTEPGTDEVNNEQPAGQGAEVEVVTSLLFTRRVDTGTVIQQKRSAGTGRRHTGDADVAAAARGEGRSCQCLPGKAGALCARHWELALTLLGLSPRGRVPAPQHTEQPARDSERRKRLCSGPATRQSGCPRTRTPFRPLAAQAPTPIQTLGWSGWVVRLSRVPCFAALQSRSPWVRRPAWAWAKLASGADATALGRSSGC